MNNSAPLAETTARAINPSFSQRKASSHRLPTHISKTVPSIVHVCPLIGPGMNTYEKLRYDSLVKPVLSKFQRFSTAERYRMLG